MAVHNEPSCRSFPSFYEADNFEDDDDDSDNNFVISLEDIRDDNGEKSNNMTSVCTSVSSVPHKPHITQNLQTSTQLAVPYDRDDQNIDAVSNSAFSSSACYKAFSTYPELIVPNINNRTQTELKPSVYNTSPKNQHSIYQHLSTVDVVPGLICSTESHLSSGSNYKKNMAVTVSCSSGSGGATISNKCALHIIDHNLSLSDTVSSHSERQNQELPDKFMHSNVSQEKLLKSPSEWPKMHLETIHLDKETGGIWSEAVFLTSVGMSDSSFSSISNDPSEKMSFERTNSEIHMKHQFVTSDIPSFSSNTSSWVPKLSGPYSKSGLETDVLCSVGVQTNSAPQIVTKRAQPLHETSACTCIMCYKGRGIVNWCPESHNENAVLTEEEKQIILKEPVKRKRLKSCPIESKKKKDSLISFCNTEMKCQQMSTLTIKGPLQTKSILGDVSSPHNVVSAVMQNTHTASVLGKHNTSLNIQPKSLTSDVSAQKTLQADLYNEHKSTVNPTQCENFASDVLVGIKNSHLQCERTTTTAASMIVLNPNLPHLVSAPRFRSNPPKVFLKPSEVSGQKFLSFTPEVTSTNSSRGSLVQATVTCRELPQTPTSASTTYSSPPSYKIIYVNQDQVLVCPGQAHTSVKFVSVNKQPQKAKPIIPHMTVLKLPQTNILNKTSVDSQLRTHLPNVVTQTSQLFMNKSSSINPSSVNPVHTINTANELRYILHNTEKVDNISPDRGLIKIKSPPNIQKGSVQNTQIVKNVVNAIIPVSKSSVYRSILKDFKLPQVKIMETTAPVHSSQACSVGVSNLGEIKVQSPVVAKPSSLEVAQTLMSLIKSHIQEQNSVSSENVLVNLIKGSLPTSESNVSCGALQPLNNSDQNSDNIISLKDHIIACEPLKDKQLLSSSERCILEETGIYISNETISNPCLPQEGLPTTYVQDWVNQTKTYETEHLKESNCLPNHEKLYPSISCGTAVNHHTAFNSSLTENSTQYILHTSKIIDDVNSSILEPSIGSETLTAPRTESQLLSSNSASDQSQKLQMLPKSLPNPSTEHNFTDDSSANMCRMGIDKQLERPSKTRIMGEQIPQSFFLQGSSQMTISTSKKPSQFDMERKNNSQAMNISPQSVCKPTVFSDLPKDIPCHTSGAVPLSSSVIDSSNGIKLKIKLSDLKKEKVKSKQSYNTLETSIGDGENETLPHGSGDEFSLLKRNVKGHEAIIGEDGGLINKPDGDKTETAEEMFQRFQEQAVQEVFKAQMGMGYLSRSLRPARATMAFIDKYPHRFGTGALKKKVPVSEENVHMVSKKTAEINNCSVPEIDEQSCQQNNAQNRKLNIHSKRHIEEARSKEIKVKQPKLSIMDYPRLKQDCSITNRKKLLCSNILAGHKVYVKFNTYENDCSGRAFLVPFFNIGGTRTQFDVEDMEYINKAVLEFEKEEKSCARHLLFYTREGQKASFLRKEKYFQSSQINEKNYRKCSFILEGFSRDIKKQTEHSPEEWKVDNTIDIEIDRAEIDNDAEVEFDVDMTCDFESIDEESIGHTLKQSAHERIKSKELHSIHAHEWSPSLSVHATHSTEPVHHETIGSSQLSISNSHVNFSNVNEGDVLTQEFEVNKKNRDKVCVYDRRKGMKTTASVTPILSDSVPHPDKTTACPENVQVVMSGCVYDNRDVNRMSQMPLKSQSLNTVMRKEVMADNKEIQHSSLGYFSAGVKQEKADDYEDIIKNLASTQTADNTCSVYFSSNSSSCNEQLFDNCSAFIKQEPVDEYFDSSVGMELGTSKHYQNQQRESEFHTITCQHGTNLYTTPSVQQKSVEKEADTVSSKADLPQQQSESVILNLPSSHARLSQGHFTESSIVSTHSTDDTACVEVEKRILKNCKVESSFTSIDTEGLMCEFVDDSLSIKTNSFTGPSLPESPLPSSSVSGSSDISASSDIDDKHASAESHCSPLSHTSLPNPEFTTDDGFIGDKHNSVQSKITSLVESLRNRLTQDTSGLPPWLASVNSSVTNARVKRRKKLKINTEKGQFQDSILPAEIQLSDTVFNSEVEVSTTALTSPSHIHSSSKVSSVITSKSDEVQSTSVTTHMPISVVPSTSTDSVPLTMNCTPSLPVDIPESFVAPKSTNNSLACVSENIPNRNPMLLPIKQPVDKQRSLVKHPTVSQVICANNGDLSSVATYTSNEVVDKVIGCEIESPLVLENDVCDENHASKIETLSEKAVDICKSHLAFESIRLNKFNSCDNVPKAVLPRTENVACSEAMNLSRQSPVDFEIEVGDEDLPETAMRLQPILPNEHLHIEAFRGRITEYDHPRTSSLLSSPNYVTPLQQHMGKKLSLSRQEIDRTKQSEDKKQWMHQKDDRTNHSEVVKESKKPKKGSVANYLCQKFSFSGAGHKTRGPRLLHMPARRKTSFREANKRQTQIQNIYNNNNTPPEPITTAELSKTPSVTEIFGGTARHETTIKQDTKMDSTEICKPDLPLNNNYCISAKQKIVSTKAQVSKKRTSNRKGRKNVHYMLNDSGSMLVKSNTAASVERHLSNQHQLSQEVPNTETISKTSMQLCKVVLTKLENLDSCDAHRLSNNVFIIKKELTEVKERPRSNITDTYSNGSLSPCSSRSTRRKVVKKKRKKTSKVIKKPGLRSKRDIVDYYAYMLETLQKKAQLLEEETKRKAGEDAKKGLNESVEVMEKSLKVDQKNEATNDICGCLNREDIHEETKQTENVLELCNMTADMDCSLQATVDAESEPPIGALNSKDVHTVCGRSLLECESSAEQSVEYNTVVHCQASDVSDSDWPYLQKFCDDTIFNQANTNYLQKMSEGISFAQLNEANVDELNFEKKDVVLGSNVADEDVHIGTLSSSQTLNEAEDTDCCLEGCSHDQESEDEMLLGLEVQKNSAFSLGDREITGNPFSLGVTSETLHKSALINNESITGNSAKSVKSSSQEIVLKTKATDDTALSSRSENDSSQSEPKDTTIFTGLVSCAVSSYTSTAQSMTPQTTVVRNIEVSPSWERLFGHNSLNISEKSADDNIISHQEPNNQSVPFVASSNFKFKFKLPKGVLSKAVKMSRGMRNVFEKPTSEDSILGNVEVLANNSLGHACEYNAHPENVHSESKQKEGCLTLAASQTLKNVNTSSSSQLKFPELKLSPVTLTAIEKAKAEFLQGRKKGRKWGLTLKHQSKILSSESGVCPFLDAGLTSSTLPQESSADSHQTLLPDNVRICEQGELSGLFAQNVSCDLNLKEEVTSACSMQSSSISTGLKQENEDFYMQTKDINFHGSLFHVSKMATGIRLPGVCVKQHGRKDGIFSSIDLFQGFSDECTAKQACELPSSKDAAVDTILKSNVIDVSKLKLKLTPLVSNKLKERAAQTNMNSVLHQETNKSQVNIDILPCKSCNDLQPKIEGVDPKTEEFLQLQIKNDVDVVETSECASDKLWTNRSEHQLFISTSKPIPQVNAAKLCSILKNFHKNANTCSTMPTVPEGTLQGIRECNNRDKTLDMATSSPSLQHPIAKSKKVGTLSGTSELRKNMKGRIGGQKPGLKSISQKAEVSVRGLRRAKENANKILTANSVKVILPVKLNDVPEENMCSSETLKSDEKSERSFFDCLSSVPLDTWEDNHN